MKRITITFLTPSYVRMLGDKTGPFLRMLFVGSEPANNIYNKNLDLINIYACSESGFAVGVFKIDQPYETCPIGQPAVETRIIRLNEAGEEVSDDEIGELCFENPYVHGYLNLPEETEKAFVEGIYAVFTVCLCRSAPGRSLPSWRKPRQTRTASASFWRCFSLNSHIQAYRLPRRFSSRRIP